MNLTPLVFEDITPVEIPVRIADVNYVLREALGEADCQYRSALTACAHMDRDSKKINFEGQAYTEALLVSLCLFKVVQKEQGLHEYHKVSRNTILAWPSRVQKALFERVQEISGLKSEENIADLKQRIAELEAELASMGTSDEEETPETIQEHIHALQKKLAAWRDQRGNPTADGSE